MGQLSLAASSLGAELHIAAEGRADHLASFVGHDFWPRFVPDVELGIGEPGKNSDLHIAIGSEATWQFDPAGRDLVLPPSNILHAICTAGYMLEAKRQALGLYTVHGNVIANDANTVALIGPISGIGKTTLSSYATSKGWQWISDEKFVLSEQGEYMGSVAGTLQDDKTKQSAGGNEPDVAEPYGRRLDAFVIPIVTDGDALVSHVYDHAKAFWHLHEDMSRDIRVVPFDLNGPEVPLPSFDTEDIATRRRKAAATLSGMVPYISVMGNGDTILDYLSMPIR